MGIDMGDDMRAALCLIGQVASPIQCHWVLSHLKVTLGFLQMDELIPNHLALILQHVASHRNLQPTLSMYERRELM